MNVKSAKRAIGLAASAVASTVMMMLAPAVANAATSSPVHVRTVSNVSRASDLWHGHHGLDGNSFRFEKKFHFEKLRAEKLRAEKLHFEKAEKKIMIIKKVEKK